ncbi:MAG TPA: hypothetical protein VJN70_15310 [Gemmatimonadaceae bacterium]|nr:hypothetical protein [Gemmatimonadaceae bacterium]
MKPFRVALVLASISCSGSLPWSHGDLANHPAAVIGEWVDVQKTTPRDSSIWVLESNGYDGGMRIRRAPNDENPHIERQRYGYWYVHEETGHAPELCVNRRPGREASACTTFSTSIDSTVVPARRAIRLTAYTGAHHTGERLLVERR